MPDAQTYTSDWIPVSDGETTTGSIPESYNLSGAEVRWRGDQAPSTTESQSIGSTATKSGSGSFTIETDYPSIQSPTGYFYQLRIENRGDTEASAYARPGNDAVHFTVAPGETEYFEREPTGDLAGKRDDAYIEEGPEKSVQIYLVSKGRLSVAGEDTHDPAVTLGGLTTTGPSELDDDETTDWLSLAGLATGENTFAHSVGGSGDVDFQFRYTYTTTNATPVAATLRPTTATGAAVAREAAQPVPATLRPTTASGGYETDLGWSATLETHDGDERMLGPAELTKVSINPEHTAAWGGTIELPPIIDPDNYRGGSMRLRYGPALMLRCPTLVKREQADDGTVTIDGLGPASLLKDSPVDTTFTDTFVHHSIDTLLRVFADFDPSNVTVHTPPRNPVDGELVQRAASETEFSEILEKRSRSATGQYQSETGGEAADWLPTDPFKYVTGADDGGGIRTLQSCVVREGEGFDRADDATTAADPDPNAAASAGAALPVLAPDTFAEWDFSFGYQIPEGSFAVGIRAQAIDVEGSGTTTIRASAGDTELFSFEASRHGDVYGWQRHDTGFQPGTDTQTLRLEVSQSGGTQLDVDAIAVYDDRYTYTFGGGVDDDGALAGPELYPDAAPLSFADAPAGIGLDEATVTATMDHAGESDRVGVVYTSYDESSGEPIESSEGSHTARFEATTTNLRPTVSLSRYSDGRTKTPTQGNQPQVLRSVETTISGNAIPIIESRSFEETSVFDAVQTLCNDYDFNFVVEHGRASGVDIEVFRRGDPTVRRELPENAVVFSSSESAAAEDYKNEVTVIGAEIPDSGGEHYSWTERDREEIAAFGREPLRLENSDLRSVNDCRAVARSELPKHLNEDERGGKLKSTPALVPPGYPYHIPTWEEDVPGWGESWGESWGGLHEVYATLESSSLSEADSASTDLDFDVRSAVLAALAGGFR